MEQSGREPVVAELKKVTELGKYRLIAELARGGMGIVYLALVRGPGGFNKLFVVKELKHHLVEDPQLVAMFLEEARLAAKLSHANVVQTIEVGSEGERHFIAMEYLEGQSLHRILQRARKTDTPFPLHFHMHVIVAALEGLEYAHGLTDFDGTELNVVHRDVSPHNVFVTYDGQVKVLDFGIAKALDSSAETRTGVLKGKVAYMAPEQAAGQSLDRRADVFAAGVMLWEAVAGKRMWADSHNDMRILHSLMNGAVPDIHEATAEVRDSLARVVAQSTAPRREDRFASAATLREALEEELKQLGAPPFGPRDLGKFVADLFSVERSKIKSVIDEQLRTLRGMASAEYSAIDLARLETMSLSGGTPSAVSLIQRSASHPSIPDLSDGGASGGFRLESTRVEGSGSHRAVQPAKPSRAALWVAIAGLLVAATAVIVFLATKQPAPAPPAASTAAPPPPTTAAASVTKEPEKVVAATTTSAPPTPPVAAPPPDVKLKIKVSPAKATIIIDGKTCENPCEMPVMREVAHLVRAEARGYKVREENVTPEHDTTLEFGLELAGMNYVPPPPKRTAAPEATVVAPPPVTTTAAPTATAPPPAKTGRPDRPIATSNPYGNGP